METNWKQLVRDFAKDDSGQDMIEYALLAGLIALVVAAAIPALTTAISASFGSITTKLGTAK